MYICVTVEVPFLNKAFDYRIPKSMKVSNAIELICDIIKDNYPGLSLETKSAELLSISQRVLLNKDFSVEKNRVINNEKLILI